MSTTPQRVLHRICPSCDRDVTGDVVACPECGTKLVEIREETDDLIGTVIDERFEVRSLLGEGGMGRVYRAWQRSVGREVAIKLMDRSFSREPMAVRRFLREARLASQLSQPNTVSVFDFGQVEDGRLFIAMELIRGRTLHDILSKDGVFSVERAARVGTQICDALDAAHAISIVHRDLKLENVIVLDHPPGRDLLKVLDFGLAKLVGESASRATESGVVVGTPRYMAPETAMEGIALPPADIYALGVILAELTIGASLWPEEQSMPALIAKKLDPDSVVVLVPAPLRHVIAEMIDPDPARRPTAQRARQLLSSLAASGEHVATPAAGTKAEPSIAMAVTRPLAKSPMPSIASAPALPATVLAPSSEIRVDVDAPAARPSRAVWYAVGGGVALVAIIVVVMMILGARSDEDGATASNGAGSAGRATGVGGSNGGGNGNSNGNGGGNGNGNGNGNGGGNGNSNGGGNGVGIGNGIGVGSGIGVGIGSGIGVGVGVGSGIGVGIGNSNGGGNGGGGNGGGGNGNGRGDGDDHRGSASAPAMVKIMVVTKPMGARISIAGVERGVSPVHIDVPRGDAPIAIVAAMPGRRAVTSKVVPSRDQSLDVTLPALPPATHAPDDKVTPF